MIDDKEYFRRAMIVGAALAGGLTLLVVEGPFVVDQLLLGWLYLPLETIPRATWDGPTVVLALVGAGLFVALSRSLMRRAGLSWSIAASVRCLVLLLMAFVAGTGSVGLLHQSLWLLADRGPASERGRDAPVLGLAVLHREARENSFRNDTKQVVAALYGVTDVYRRFPAGGTFDRDGRQLHGWLTALGPFLAFQTHEIDFTIPWHEGTNARLFRCAMPYFLDPLNPQIFDANGFGVSHLAANGHVLPSRVRTNEDGRSALTEGGPRQEEITDGASQTILLGQVSQRPEPWGSPLNVRDPTLGINRSPQGFGATSGSRGALFAMVDGHVRLVSDTIDDEVLRALATPRGGEAVPKEW